MAAGTLYLVATPIGNLEDITLRALRVLKEVDRIACEDTRRTAKLLNHFGIATPTESYHAHNEASRTPRLVELLRHGRSVALVSDAGTPLVSDPGHRLVAACRQEAIAVVPVPGPVAAVAALAGSGLPSETFYFAGFLDSRRAARRKKLADVAAIPTTLIFYEAPHRTVAALEDMCSVLGPRDACLARELTKLHEEWLRGTLCEILDVVKARPKIEGEVTIVVAPPLPRVQAEHTFPDSIEEHLQREMSRTGASRKEALREVARQRGISRRAAYQTLVGKDPGGERS
jgi:16S rRNA (cytidine1402-2'-O)-methyltransferase